jgi:hypothetical protein
MPRESILELFYLLSLTKSIGTVYLLPRHTHPPLKKKILTMAGIFVIMFSAKIFLSILFYDRTPF